MDEHTFPLTGFVCKMAHATNGGRGGIMSTPRPKLPYPCNSQANSSSSDRASSAGGGRFETRPCYTKGVNCHSLLLTICCSKNIDKYKAHPVCFSLLLNSKFGQYHTWDDDQKMINPVKEDR